MAGTRPRSQAVMGDPVDLLRSRG